MAEWSNATDLRSVLFGGAGSNPAGDILGANSTYKQQTLLWPRWLRRRAYNAEIVGSSPTRSIFKVLTATILKNKKIFNIAL